ncbi:class I SAM-dependent methyltransferase [Halobacteriales archaeon QS_5_70_17]|nr:MAG: class I SAM-dependent methyltransferase [Halobacteriales archaeon QS_5_70_17]
MSGDWQVLDGAIVERPREVGSYPLLSAVYDRHDRLIDRRAVEGRSLEVAFGTRPHPGADVGVEAFPENARDADGIAAAAADARDLPFDADSFSTVVGRRFLHHVPAADRRAILREARRVLESDGRLILLEGTPGAYRRLTKGLAFRLGVLGDDNDEYGHLSADRIRALLDETGFEIEETRPLGSPLMPCSAFRSSPVERLIDLVERTQWVRWWTLAVARPETVGGSEARDGGSESERTPAVQGTAAAPATDSARNSTDK